MSSLPQNCSIRSINVLQQHCKLADSDHLNTGAQTSLPTCDQLTDKIRLSQDVKRRLQWFTCLDMTHETMFAMSDSENTLLEEIENIIRGRCSRFPSSC